MVLYDVAYDAILVEVARTPRDADGLLEGDAHVGHVVGVEEPAELAVGEAEGEQIGDERLREVVVDPEGLRLSEVLR